MEDILNALNNMHTINGRKFRVKLTPCSVCEPLLPFETAAECELNLLQLNNDCLMNIMRNLPVGDLITVADTCQTLRQTTLDVFRYKHKVLNLGVGYPTNAFTPSEIVRAVKLFGSGTTALNISMRCISNPDCQRKIISTIAKQCDSLRSLKLNRVIIDEEMLPDLHQIFDKLETLKLICCRIERGANDFFTNCESLLKLKLVQNDGVEVTRVETKYFPKLESFTFYAGGDYSFPETFYEQHKNLKKLNFDHRDISMNLVALHCTRLEKLCITANVPRPISFHPDHKFEHLKHLRVCWWRRGDQELLRLLQSCESVEHLEFENDHIEEEIFHKIHKLQHLKVLGLPLIARYRNVGKIKRIDELIISNSCNFDDLAKNLTSLKALTIFGDTHNIHASSIQNIATTLSQRFPGERLILNEDRSVNDLAEIVSTCNYRFRRNYSQFSHAIESDHRDTIKFNQNFYFYHRY